MSIIIVAVLVLVVLGGGLALVISNLDKKDNLVAFLENI